MKTIEEAAKDFNDSHVNGHHPQKWVSDIFKAGVDFAQQFYPIERDQYAEIDLKQKEELECNMPILVKYLNEDGETTYDVFAEYYPVLQDPIYTHWRPINLK